MPELYRSLSHSRWDCKVSRDTDTKDRDEVGDQINRTERIQRRMLMLLWYRES